MIILSVGWLPASHNFVSVYLAKAPNSPAASNSMLQQRLDKVMSFTQNFVTTSWPAVNSPELPFGAGGWPQCTLVGGTWPEEPQTCTIFHHLCPTLTSPLVPTLVTAS